MKPRKTATLPPFLHGQQGGFSLAEIVLALGIIGIAMSGILALIPTALRSAQDSQHETQAVLISRKIFADLKASSDPQKALVIKGTNFPNGDSASFDLTQSKKIIIGYDMDGKPRGTISGSISNEIKESGWVYAVELTALPENTGLPNLSRVEAFVTTPASAALTNRTTFSFFTLFDTRTP